MVGRSAGQSRRFDKICPQCGEEDHRLPSPPRGASPRTSCEQEARERRRSDLHWQVVYHSHSNPNAAPAIMRQSASPADSDEGARS